MPTIELIIRTQVLNAGTVRIIGCRHTLSTGKERLFEIGRVQYGKSTRILKPHAMRMAMKMVHAYLHELSTANTIVKIEKKLLNQ